MLNEYISSQRSAFISLVIFTAFLLITILDVISKASRIHELERTVVTHNLLSESSEIITLPSVDESDSDIVKISLTDSGFGNLRLAMALAHLNYALPIYFGEEFCFVEDSENDAQRRRIIYAWMDWEVRVSPRECIKQKAKDYRYPYEDVTTLKPLINERLKHLDTDWVRSPYNFENLETESAEAFVKILSLLHACLYQDPEDDMPIYFCKIKKTEKEASEDLYFQQVGQADHTQQMEELLDVLTFGEINSIEEENAEELKFSSEDGVQLSSVEVELIHLKSDTTYYLFVSNAAKYVHRNNPELNRIQAVDIALVKTPWKSSQYTEDELLDEIKLAYSTTSGNSTDDKTPSDLIYWAYLEIKKFTEGKVQAPFIGSAIPISTLLAACLTVYFVILVWAYFLASSIKQKYPQEITVPWLLNFIAVAINKKMKTSTAVLDVFLGAIVLCFRVFVIVAPSIAILLFVNYGGAAVGYVLPKPATTNIVSFFALILGLFAIYLITIEISTIKKICTSSNK